MPNVNLAPYSAEQAELQRRRQLAAALQQQSMAPLDMPQYPGANVSWSQGAAKLAQALVAALQNRKLDKKERALEERMGQERLQTADATVPTGTGAYQTLPSPVGPPQTIERLAGPQEQDTRAALVRALAGSDPRQQQLAQFSVQNMLGQQQAGQREAAEQARLLQQQGFQREQLQTELSAKQKDILKPDAVSYSPGTLIITRDAQGKEIGRETVPFKPEDTTPNAPHTVQTAEGVLQWDAKTNKWFKIGDRPPSAREDKVARPVTSGDANRIADFNTSLDDVEVLTSVVGTGATGTRAKLGAMAPNWLTELTGWGADAKSRQAVIDRVKQVIGKALEGGVLRKEDEYKYEKILPTIYDVPTVVTAKLSGLKTAIGQRQVTLLDALEDAGYDVGRYRARDAAGEGDTNIDSVLDRVFGKAPNAR